MTNEVTLNNIQSLLADAENWINTVIAHPDEVGSAHIHKNVRADIQAKSTCVAINVWYYPDADTFTNAVYLVKITQKVQTAADLQEIWESLKACQPYSVVKRNKLLQAAIDAATALEEYGVNIGINLDQVKSMLLEDKR